jgi:hypothetical protein
MSLDPKQNKYVKNMSAISAIQEWLIDTADALHIPKLNNKNLDTSIGLVHRAFLRTFRTLKRKKTLLNEDHTAAEYFLEEFEHIKMKLRQKNNRKNAMKMQPNMNPPKDYTNEVSKEPNTDTLTVKKPSLEKPPRSPMRYLDNRNENKDIC